MLATLAPPHTHIENTQKITYLIRIQLENIITHTSVCSTEVSKGRIILLEINSPTFHHKWAILVWGLEKDFKGKKISKINN